MVQIDAREENTKAQAYTADSSMIKYKHLGFVYS